MTRCLNLSGMTLTARNGVYIMTKINITKTVELFTKGVKATKLDAQFVANLFTTGTPTENYKAVYNRLVNLYKEAYEEFTTAVKNRQNTEEFYPVYCCFDATVKQLQNLFPDREIAKRKEKEFDLDAYVATFLKTLQEKGCLAEGITLVCSHRQE